MTIGAPLPRQDAAVKVTGAAQYVGDLEVPGALEGVFVVSAVAAGRIRSIDRADALTVPGVVSIFGPGQLGVTGPIEHWAAGQASMPMTDAEIRYEGQPVALVLATTGIAAREAAARLVVTIDPLPHQSSFAASLDLGIEIKDWAPTSTAVGSVADGLAAAEVTITARYRTADRHHVALEPSAVVARWVDGGIDLWTSTQWVFGVRAAMAQMFSLPPDKVRVRSGYVGGGFGAKGSTWPHEFLAVAASRAVAAPVRIVLPRSQTFTLHGYQPATVQELTLGARNDGTLTAIRHESWNAASVADDYVEHGSLGSRTMYACPNIETRDRIVRLNRPQPTFMRAPHEGPGMVGLEIAMDELADRLDMDPVELRIRNYARHDPTSGKPFSSKALDQCYRLGAERFGWARRSPVPAAWGPGGVRIGMGMASALMSTFRFGASARVTLERDGSTLVETGAHEIGTGVRTILPQIAADALGLPIERVRVSLGDTTLPEAGGTFGSATTLSVGSAVRIAAVKLKERLETLAGEPGLEPREYAEVLALHRLERVSEEGTWAPTREEGAYAMNAYGAVFVEVAVAPHDPVPRVTRCVGAFSVGRIINPRTARSQVIGGMIWGLGQALLEDSRLDPALGRFVAKGFGSYQIPVNADVPAVDAIFADEFDPHASPIGARGVGEIGTIGVGAAVANAVFNATGVRVRDLPIRVESLLQP